MCVFLQETQNAGVYEYRCSKNTWWMKRGWPHWMSFFSFSSSAHLLPYNDLFSVAPTCLVVCNEDVFSLATIIRRNVHLFFIKSNRLLFLHFEYLPVFFIFFFMEMLFHRNMTKLITRRCRSIGSGWSGKWINSRSVAPGLWGLDCYHNYCMFEYKLCHCLILKNSPKYVKFVNFSIFSQDRKKTRNLCFSNLHEISHTRHQLIDNHNWSFVDLWPPEEATLLSFPKK